MVSTLINNTLRFFILIVIQVLILNNIQLFRIFNPYLYILFILLLPFNTPRWIVLFTSFFLGLFIDMFMNTIGMNIAASVFVAYLRPYIINFITPKGGYEPEMEPTIRSLGFYWFLGYVLIMIFLHHLFLFYIEVFNFSEFFSTLFRVFINSIITLSLVILSQYLFYGKKSY